MRSFAIAIQFLTRIPIRLQHAPNQKEIGLSLNYYPLVGLLLGVLLYALALLLHSLPVMLSAALITVFWTLITGGLHLDGLADSADAWIGGIGDSSKTLSIMKDPACGPAGVVSIVLVLLVKFAAIYSLLQINATLLIILAPALARTLVMLLVSLTPYVREQGLGRALKAHAKPSQHIVIASLLSVVLVIVLGVVIVPIIVLQAVLFFILRFAMMRRLQGITGDLAGAALEISEVTVLISLLVI